MFDSGRARDSNGQNIPQIKYLNCAIVNIESVFSILNTSSLAALLLFFGCSLPASLSLIPADNTIKCDAKMPTLNLSDLNVIISVLGNYLLAFPA